MSKLSRRDFISTGAAAAATAATVGAAPAATASAIKPRYRRILIAPQSSLAVRTASSELAQATGASVTEWDRTRKIESGDIVLALGEDIRVFPEAASRLSSISIEKEWELVIPARGGLVIAGSTPRNVCKASLSWIADPARMFTSGGLFSSPQCQYNINQELYGELIRGKLANPDQFLLTTAERWCEGDRESASALVEAWKTGDEAMRAWPRLSWYTGGGAQVQAHWVIRPLVPDITRLNEHERSAWERGLFPLPHDIARLNIMFEAGIRYFDEDELAGAVRAFEGGMLPRLEKTVEILDRALDTGKKPVIEDQRDRYRGILLRSRTDCHLYQAQIAINNWLLKKGDPAAERRRLDTAIGAEMVNTRDWIHALETSKTNWFHLAAQEQTLFLYKTPVEDLKIKLTAMQAHRNDEPGPYLPQLLEPKPTLLFSAAFH